MGTDRNHTVIITGLTGTPRTIMRRQDVPRFRIQCANPSIFRIFDVAPTMYNSVNSKFREWALHPVANLAIDPGDRDGNHDRRQKLMRTTSGRVKR